MMFGLLLPLVISSVFLIVIIYEYKGHSIFHHYACAMCLISLVML